MNNNPIVPEIISLFVRALSNTYQAPYSFYNTFITLNPQVNLFMKQKSAEFNTEFTTDLFMTPIFQNGSSFGIFMIIDKIFDSDMYHVNAMKLNHHYDEHLHKTTYFSLPVPTEKNGKNFIYCYKRLIKIASAILEDMKVSEAVPNRYLSLYIATRAMAESMHDFTTKDIEDSGVLGNLGNHNKLEEFVDFVVGKNRVPDPYMIITTLLNIGIEV